MQFDLNQLNFGLAFLGGIISFLSSCLLPLVPTYLAYLAGISTHASGKQHRSQLIINSILFVTGFVGMFVLFGLSANKLATFINLNQTWIQKLSGIFVILMGLFLIDKLPIEWLYRERRLSLDARQLTPFHQLNSLLFGITFGIAWTPCVGPMLAVILYWAGQQATAALGMKLLLAFGLGLGTPFILLAVLFAYGKQSLSFSPKLGHYLRLIAGGVIILSGILIYLGLLQAYSLFLLRLVGISPFSL